MLKTLTSTLLITGAMLMTASCKPSDAELKKAIEDTIKENPEIIIQALEDYQNKMEQKQADSQKEALSSSKDALYNDGHSLILGNPNGDVTIIAFKDYRCGYCKRAWDSVIKLTETDKNVRIILKEMPILGAASTLASKYGLASDAQGKYAAYYDALMRHRGPWTKEGLVKIAETIGLDTDKLAQDAEADSIKSVLQSNIQLAQKLGITGTPAFIIGEQLLPGAVPLATLQKLVTEERAK